MTKDLKDRTKKFAVTLIRFIRTLPKTDEGYILGKQLLRSGLVLEQTIDQHVEGNQRQILLIK